MVMCFSYARALSYKSCTTKKCLKQYCDHDDPIRCKRMNQTPWFTRSRYCTTPWHYEGKVPIPLWLLSNHFVARKNHFHLSSFDTENSDLDTPGRKIGLLCSCQFWSLTRSTSIGSKRQGVYLGVKKGEFIVFAHFSHKKFAKESLFCAIFPDTATNMQQSTGKEEKSWWFVAIKARRNKVWHKTINFWM